MKPVSLTKAAKNEIERAAQYYEQQREGLGLRFTDKVEEAIDRIALNPLAYRRIIGEARRAALAQFPYQIWFTIKPDGSLVIACLHERRSSGLVRERVKGVIPFPNP